MRRPFRTCKSNWLTNQDGSIHTSEIKREKYARICVEVDTKETLPESTIINKRWLMDSMPAASVKGAEKLVISQQNVQPVNKMKEKP